MTSVKDNDVLSIRVRSDVKELFLELSRRQQLTQNELFSQLMKQYQAGRGGQRLLDLQRAHAQLTATCQQLERQLFDVFADYNAAIEAVQAESGDAAQLQEQNRQLQAMVLEQRQQLKEKDSVIAEQKEMLDYLTTEFEKLQDGEEPEHGNS